MKNSFIIPLFVLVGANTLASIAMLFLGISAQQIETNNVVLDGNLPYTEQEIQEDQEIYDDGEFFFAHPQGYSVTRSESENETNFTIFPRFKCAQEAKCTESNGVPAMTIEVTKGDVVTIGSISFALWEDIAWEGFDMVVESFEIK